MRQYTGKRQRHKTRRICFVPEVDDHRPEPDGIDDAIRNVVEHVGQCSVSAQQMSNFKNFVKHTGPLLQKLALTQVLGGVLGISDGDGSLVGQQADKWNMVSNAGCSWG